jgi:hypothetical protein
LETWTETRGAVAPANRALINIQLTIVEAELQETFEVYKAISPEYRLETLHKLRKLIPTAQALVDETRDKELGQILATVATLGVRTFYQLVGQALRLLESPRRPPDRLSSLTLMTQDRVRMCNVKP